MLPEETYYDILGVSPDASHRELRQAFLALRAKQHSAMVSDPSALRLFDDAKTAYDALSNYDARCQYNAENSLPPPRTPPTRHPISSLQEEEDRLAFWSRYVRWSTWGWTWPRSTALYILLVFAAIGVVTIVLAQPEWLWEMLRESR